MGLSSTVGLISCLVLRMSYKICCAAELVHMDEFNRMLQPGKKKMEKQLGMRLAWL